MSSNNRRWEAMFSVAGAPYESLGIYEDRVEADDAIAAEALMWSCRTHGYVKEASDELCTWKSGNTPCSVCPKRMSALHMCKLLQNEASQNEQE